MINELTYEYFQYSENINPNMNYNNKCALNQHIKRKSSANSIPINNYFRTKDLDKQKNNFGENKNLKKNKSLNNFYTKKYNKENIQSTYQIENNNRKSNSPFQNNGNFIYNPNNKKPLYTETPLNYEYSDECISNISKLNKKENHVFNGQLEELKNNINNIKIHNRERMNNINNSNLKINNRNNAQIREEYKNEYSQNKGINTFYNQNNKNNLIERIHNHNNNNNFNYINNYLSERSKYNIGNQYQDNNTGTIKK